MIRENNGWFYKESLIEHRMKMTSDSVNWRFSGNVAFFSFLYLFPKSLVNCVGRYIISMMNCIVPEICTKNAKVADTYSMIRVMRSPNNKQISTISAWLWTESNLCGYCITRSGGAALCQYFVNRDRLDLSVGYTTNQSLTSSRKRRQRLCSGRRVQLRVWLQPRTRRAEARPSRSLRPAFH